MTQKALLHFTVFTILIYFNPLYAQSSVRAKAHDEAVKQLLNLNFYYREHGMHMAPNMIKLYEFSGGVKNPLVRKKVKDEWGLNIINNKIVGLFNVKDEPYKIGVIGCVACHSGYAAGKFIVGLGNKNIDVNEMARQLVDVTRWWKKRKSEKNKSQKYKNIEEHAETFSKYLAQEDIGNLTQGLVPVSFIRGWFYKIQNREIPQLPRGQVKVPQLWGYGPKREVGQFCDGYGDGNEVGWALAVELAAGQTPSGIRDLYAKAIDAEHLLEDLLPPKYPFKIDETLATQGEQIFLTTCANCHGQYTYDKEDLPIYQAPKWIPWSTVRTDTDRIDGNTPEFNGLVAVSPLSDIIKFYPNRYGYFAPRLNGIWSRFPYLHNNSVPNIMALLTPPAQRPQIFSLEKAGAAKRFDQKYLGLKLLNKKLNSNDRNIYNTKRIGHSNQGHNFYTGISKNKKLALIEYLKTL